MENNKFAEVWFLELPQEIREKAINNLNEKTFRVEYSSLLNALACAFDWKNSNEGLDYWTNIYKGLMNS